jgi:hypothetical protein
VEQKRLDSADRAPLLPDGDDSGLVVSFAVGPSGVGPVMGFGSDDFFPVAPDGPQVTDQPEDVVTSPADEPIGGANAPSG